MVSVPHPTPLISTGLSVYLVATSSDASTITAAPSLMVQIEGLFSGSATISPPRASFIDIF